MLDDEVEQPTSPARRSARPGWTPLAAVGGAGLVLGLLLGAGGVSVGSAIAAQQKRAVDAQAAAAENDAELSLFTDAVQGCGAGPSASADDGGRSLTIDQRGKEDFDGISADSMWCTVDALNAPAAVVSHMEQNTSLDGRQTETWDDIEVSWSYHPDRGMDSVWRLVS